VEGSPTDCAASTPTGSPGLTMDDWNLKCMTRCKEKKRDRHYMYGNHCNKWLMMLMKLGCKGLMQCLTLA
jgi:hypothetical protein